MKYSGKNHTFAICAYKESPYLEDCICSIKKQKIPSNIIITTSTPNNFISNLTQKYEIPLIINNGDKGITQDWNFAYSKVETDLVTLTHQDDIYTQDYLQYVLEKLNISRKPLIFFTDYYELREKKLVRSNGLLKIKRLMLLPLRIKMFSNSRFIRRRMLSFGSPICCPSVTFVRPFLPKEVFQHDFKANEDWQAWERLSNLEGEFVYCNKPLMYHRIHTESETSAIIANNERTQEDYIMFLKFWPKPIAKFLTKLYRLSEHSNKIDK